MKPDWKAVPEQFSTEPLTVGIEIASAGELRTNGDDFYFHCIILQQFGYTP
jgi:hypothetical protein